MRVLYAAALALCITGPTVAQTPGTRYRPTMPRVDMTTRFGATASENQDRFMRSLRDPTQQVESSAVSRQEALIVRVAPLVADGRCDAARQIARAEGDRALSRRIGEVCVEGRPTPMDTATPG